MIHYSRILQTGIQSLLAVGCGWGCGRWAVVDPEPTVAYTNTLVLRFCIPCLQVWLLAVETDMQQADNWRALFAFLVWSLGLQALLALHQLLTQQRLQLDRLGVDGLILTTNNTGILGPVVLEAAVGAQYAPLGMLATVGLYFQQLPLAQLLFQLHQRQQQQQHGLSSPNLAATAIAGGFSQKGLGKVATSPEPCSSDTHSASGIGAHRQKQQHHTQQLLQATAGGRSSSQAELVHLSRSAAAENGRQQHGARPSWDLEHQQQQGSVELASAAADADGCEGRPLLGSGGSSVSQPPPQQTIPSFVLSLLLKNPLVWSTAVAVVLSSCGSAAVLDPSSPLALKHLAFLEALLGWFAQTTAPLTLFTTGLWMYSNQQQQQQGTRHADHSVVSSSGVTAPLPPAAAAVVGPCQGAYGSRDVAWRDALLYLGLRATLAPALMVVVCLVLGFRGDLAHALVILSLLPVAQTAFVVCKQAETGMAAVSFMLVASLFMMLPQLMVVLAVLERLGLLSAA